MNFRQFLGNLFWGILKGFPLQAIFCCDIPLWELPKSTIFPHAVGIVINDGTVWGENVLIYQNVTIGMRYPNIIKIPAVIGDNAVIGAGAIILGAVHIGKGAVIGAGAIVLEDVPENTVYVGKISPKMHRRQYDFPRRT